MRAPSQVDTIAIGEMKFVSEIGLNQHACSHKRETPRNKLVESRFQRPAGVAASVRLHETSSWRPEADINSICVADKANSSPHDQCAQGRLSSRMSLGNIDLH